MIQASLLSVVISLVLSTSTCWSSDTRNLMEDIGVRRGIGIVLEGADCGTAVHLARETDLLIYVQLKANADLQAACRAVDAAGFYGNRIWVERGSPAKIHLADNVADVLIAEGAVSDRLPDAEAMRVIRPGGRALVGQRKLVKPVPDGRDDWSHPYHGPDNNPQSGDRIARAPYLTQFLAEPYYAPLTQVCVTSAGRVFKAFGNIAFHVREEAFLNSLVAFNGYNGTMLWRRTLTPGVMIHRNTMIATPDVLYVADDKSCKLIDAVSGKLLDEIVPPADIAGGTFWKWMAWEDDVLYALIGEQEQPDPVTRQRREAHGWPWDPLSKGFNQSRNPWGFGHHLLAFNTKSKEVIWSHREEQPIDSRALCMSHGRIFLYAHGSFLACLDATSGETIWRKTATTAPALFEKLGPHLNRQDWRTNWRTTAYAKCSEQAIYLAGPTVNKLLAVSATDGGLLWEHPYDNFQLILRDDGLYCISGQIDEQQSLKLDPLTGELLAELPTHRRGCTRPTGSFDAIFYRAMGGSIRFDIDSRKPQWVSPMRPQCHDGVTIANGLLYWWPSVCDCQNSLYGVTCLGPAGDFEFSPPADGATRLEDPRETTAQTTTDVAVLPESPADWPTFRADPLGSATTDAVVCREPADLWEYRPEVPMTPTAPVTVDGLIFFGGSDGTVRALDARTGAVRWKAFTGGAIRYPPTVWNGRLYVGSGDGWAYAWEAVSGRRLWRFRAAPAERKIPVYGALSSTWPVASGVLVEDGVAYFAAGIVNYDGTHLFAVDAETGAIVWQNSSSGHLNADSRTGVSVQGHMLLHAGKLYLAGGTSVSPAVYDVANGQCLNDPELLRDPGSTAIRGQELYKVGDKIVVSGKPLYAHPDFPVYDPTVTDKMLHTSSRDRDVVWLDGQKLVGLNRIPTDVLNRCVADAPQEAVHMIGTWGNFSVPDNKPSWVHDCERSVAFARGRNAVVLAGTSRAGVGTVEAVDVKTGQRVWQRSLSPQQVPIPWGLALDRAGRVITVLKGGGVICLGSDR